MINVDFLFYSLVSSQETNPALRLKSEIDDNLLLTAAGSGGSGRGGSDLQQLSTGPRSGHLPYENEVDDDAESAVTGIAWEYFDERSYIEAGGLRPGEDVYGRNKFNQDASDRLASNRDVPDTRSSQCRGREWRADLPPTSIIITFHNEARSTLLRTIVR